MVFNLLCLQSICHSMCLWSDLKKVYLVTLLNSAREGDTFLKSTNNIMVFSNYEKRNPITTQINLEDIMPNKKI